MLKAGEVPFVLKAGLHHLGVPGLTADGFYDHCSVTEELLL